MADLLEALVNGTPLGPALTHAAHTRPTDGSPPLDEPTVLRWFQAWVSGGLFARIHTSE
jgi:hypothetical protein